MRVLIADDDAVSRRLLQAHLQAWGYEVTAVPDGAEAWRQFEAGNFPLVLSDWMMPGLDGPALVRRIRGANRPDYVYIILLTSRAEKRDVVEGMEAGADDFIAKPFDRDELRVRVRAGERIIRLEQHLGRTRAALAQAETLAGLGRLAAGVAHEVNNPIAFVSNNLAVLRRDVSAAMRLLDVYRDGHAALARAEPDRAAAALRLEDEIDLAYIRDNVAGLIDRSLAGLDRVRHIVANLRNFARLDEAERKEADLTAGLSATAEVLRHEFDQRGVCLQMTLQPLPPLWCQPARLNQVFLHVLRNAVLACSSGGTVEVRTRAEGPAGVLIEIEDNGVGIKPEHLSRVFEPFFTTRDVGQGAGLGLAVSYGIVRDHGGSITIDSTPGRGSVVRLYLPLQPGEIPLKSSDDIGR